MNVTGQGREVADALRLGSRQSPVDFSMADGRSLVGIKLRRSVAHDAFCEPQLTNG